jgi:hypothetical protein
MITKGLGMAGNRKSEITIAAIGLVGVIVTAVASNWDKISSPSSASNLPIASDDINVQLRYYVESTGLRTTLESLEKAKAERYRLQYKADPDTVNCMIDMGLQSSQLIEIAVNSLKGHFTLEDIKELNRINASPVMKRLAEKQPAISLDLVKGLEEAFERAHRRNIALAGNNRISGKQSVACPAG